MREAGGFRTLGVFSRCKIGPNMINTQWSKSLFQQVSLSRSESVSPSDAHGSCFNTVVLTQPLHHRDDRPSDLGGGDSVGGNLSPPPGAAHDKLSL